MSTPEILIPAHPTNYRSTRARRINMVVLHMTVTNPGPPNGLNVARFFASQHAAGRASSAHVTVDGGPTRYRSVLDGATAYAAPNANANGLHLEMAGQPTRDADQAAAFWATDTGQSTLGQAAEKVREWCDTYDIPKVWLSVADVKAGKSGITDHWTCTQALGGSHWDVGAGFPGARLLELVQGVPAPVIAQPPAPGTPRTLNEGDSGADVASLQALLNAKAANALVVDGRYGPATKNAVTVWQQTHGLVVDGMAGPATLTSLALAGAPVAPSPPPPPVIVPPAFNAGQVRQLQEAVHTVADGKWGGGTDARLQNVRAAATGAGFDVHTAQDAVGVKSDGVWGPKSKAALLATVHTIQTILGVASDGAWGPVTTRAYETVRQAAHIY